MIASYDLVRCHDRTYTMVKQAPTHVRRGERVITMAEYQQEIVHELTGTLPAAPKTEGPCRSATN